MSMPKYAGVALGGPAAGTVLENFRPEVMVRPKIIGIGQRLESSQYYFVPLFGLRGVWLHESETKGRQPFDDIIRILVEHYVNTVGTTVEAGGATPNDGGGASGSA